MKLNQILQRTLIGTAVTLAAAGVNAADISLTPSASTVNVDGTFTVSVDGSNFADGDVVGGGGVLLSWDTTYLTLISDQDAINASAADNGFTDTNFFAFNDVGTIRQLDATYVAGLSDPPVNTPFQFFSLTFRAIAAIASPGTAIDLAANPDGWIDGGDGTYSPSYSGTSIAVVNEVPLPAAVWLFGTGLLGLAGVARRRNQASV